MISRHGCCHKNWWCGVFARLGPSIRWGSATGLQLTGTTLAKPQDAWTDLPLEAHTIHYERGPVPFLLIRRKISGGSLGGPRYDTDRGVNMIGIPLWAGETIELDCNDRWQIRAPNDLYGFSDVALRNNSVPTEGGDTLSGNALVISTLVDVPPDFRGTGLIQANWQYTTTAAAADTIIFNVPARGIKFAEIVAEVTALVSTATAVLTVQAFLEGIPTGASTAMGATLDTTGQQRATAFCELNSNGSDVFNISPGDVGGRLDRIQLSCDAAVAVMTINFHYQGNRGAK